jgi:PAS domain S-box-containing protein
MINQVPDTPREAEAIVFAYDLQGNFTFINRAAEMISGYSCKEACRMKVDEIVAPDMLDDLRGEINGRLNESCGAVYVLDIITKYGIRMPLEVSARVIRRNGRAIEIEGRAMPEVRLRELRDGTTPAIDSDFLLSRPH